MTAKRPHWDSADRAPAPLPGGQPILPPLATVCGEALSSLSARPPTLAPIPAAAEMPLLRPRASWPMLTLPPSEPGMEQAAPTLQFPNFHIENPGRYRQQPSGGNRYHRLLPLSPSREASNSSDDSQRSPAADAVRAPNSPSLLVEMLRGHARIRSRESRLSLIHPTVRRG